MSNTRSGFESTGTDISDGEDKGTQEFGVPLPDNFRQLAAMTAAAKAKMDELRTTKVEPLRARWSNEAAALGMTPEEVLGIAGTKRGRKAKSKRED